MLLEVNALGSSSDSSGAAITYILLMTEVDTEVPHNSTSCINLLNFGTGLLSDIL